MAFDVNGVFQRLFSWRQDRDNGVPIDADRMDAEFDGIASALTQIVQGTQPFKGELRGIDGSLTAPAYSFYSASNTGMWRSASGELNFSVAGALKLALRSSTALVTTPLDLAGALNVTSGREILKHNGNVVLALYQAAGTETENVFLGRNAGNASVGSGYVNTYDGTRNTGIGTLSLFNIALGHGNTAVGHRAGYALTDGSKNIAIGFNALQAETSGENNVAVGSYALYAQNGGHSNVAVGRSAAQNCTTGNRNTSVGYYALSQETTGINNTAIGQAALFNQDGANYNTAVGSWAGDALTTGSYNTAVGATALTSETTGTANAVFGYGAGRAQNGASYNTLIGHYTGFEITTGSYNTIVGRYSGSGITTGNNNTIIGANVSFQNNVSNNIAIATGDGSIRLRFDGQKWVVSPKVMWLEHPNAELHFDTGQTKRITCNDGGDDFNLHMNVYYDAGTLRYAQDNAGGASISMSGEGAQDGAVAISAIGNDGATAAGNPITVTKMRSMRIRTNLNTIEFYDGGGWNWVWHHGIIDECINALPAASTLNTTVSVPASDGKCYSISLLREPDYVSGDVAVPAKNAYAEVTHGLGSRPRNIQVWLICMTAEGGWAPGDMIQYHADYMYYGVNTIFSDSNVIRVYHNAGVLQHRTKDGTTYFNLTEANWVLRIYAWR